MASDLLGAAEDILTRNAPAQPALQPTDDGPGQFSRGLRSGFSGAVSQLNAAAGGLAEAAGFDGVAADRYQAMREAQADAEANAPRVGSYKDVHGIRDAYDYVTGLVGQSVPQSAAAVGGALFAKTPVGRAVGATLANTPFEAGDVVQRQQNDPASMRQDAVTRGGQALAGGLASSAAQSILPAAVAGKMAAPVLGAERVGLRQALSHGVRELPGAMLTEAASEGAGEVAKQMAHQASSPGLPMDWEQVKENAVGGAAAGGAMHGAGVAVQAARAGAASPANTLVDVSKAVKDAAVSGAQALGNKTASVADSAGAAASELGQKVNFPDPVEAARSIYDKGTTAARAFWESVAGGEDTASLLGKAGKTAEQIKEALPTIDAERLQKVSDAAQALWQNKGLSEQQRAQLGQAMQNLGDKANQQFVATLKLGQQAGEAFGKRAKNLFDSFADTVREKVQGAKKSEDFGGVRQAIAQELVPLLQRNNPRIFTDPEALGHAADGLRLAIEAMREKGVQGLTSEQLGSLIETFGEHTSETLHAVSRAMGAVKPEEQQRLYAALNAVDARLQAQMDVHKLMMDSVHPHLKDSLRASDVADELRALRKWAEGRGAGSKEEQAFHANRVQRALAERYKHPEAIVDALDANTKRKESSINSAASEEDRAELKGSDSMTEREAPKFGDAVYYGPEKGGLAMHPKLDPAGEKGQAIQAAERARKQNPDRHIRFLSAAQLGDDHPAVLQHLKSLQNTMSPEEARAELKKYGMTVAEGQRDAGQITKEDMKAIQVKENAGHVGRSKYNQASIFKVDNTAYDAIAMTKMIERQFKDEYTNADERAGVNRRARMFLTAVAALQDHLGKSFELSPELVIDHQGTTVAKIKTLDLTPRAADGGEHVGAAQLQDEGRRLRNTLNQLEMRLSDAEEGTERHARLQQRVESVEGRLADVEKRWRAADRAERIQGVIEGSGRYEADPRGPIFELGDRPEPLHTNETGNSRAADQRSKDTPVPEKKLSAQEYTDLRNGHTIGDDETVAKSSPVRDTVDLLADKFSELAENGPSAAAKLTGYRGRILTTTYPGMDERDQRRLNALLTEGTKASDAASTVNALWKKYYGEGSKVQAQDKPQSKAAPAAGSADVDHDFAHEKYPEFKTDRDAAKYLLQAYKRYGELAAEERRIMDDLDHPEGALPQLQHDAFFRLSTMFDRDSYADLGSFLPNDDGSGENDTKLRAWLKKTAPEVAAQLPKDGKASLQGTGTQRVTSAQMQDVRRYVDKVLGPKVRTSLANILHAGEYREASDTIRVSVHALNPMTVAYHEALHAFVAKLAKQGNGDVASVLKTVAVSEPVLRQLRTLLAGEHAALAQLSDPEEAAAYMYQFWAAGQLKVGDRTRNVFERIKEAIAKVFGVWSNDRRAEAIMDYFHAGEFASKGLGQQNAVARALMKAGRNEILDRAHELTKPLVQAADALSTAGGQRLRDTGIPALRELADIMKATGRGTTADEGYVPAARTERTRVMNELGQQLRGYTGAQMDEALEAMQTGGLAASKEARMIQASVQRGPNALLPRMLQYMKGAGVDLAKVQPRPDYFPRLYDAHYISRHQAEFQAVLERNGVGQKEAQAITSKLITADGAEFTIERDRPGMQFAKTRKLADIPDAQLAPFMRKNMVEILSSYVTQATRRAEWARRVGDDGLGITRRLEQAKAQGATPEQLQGAEKFVRAVDGTLGDTLSPAARRVMGNMIVYQNLRLLPLAIFSSVVDPLGIMVRGGTTGDALKTFVRGIREIPASWRGNFQPDVHTNIAETMGVIDDAMLSDTVGQLYTQGLVGDTARKINDTFFRFNLMEGFNRSMRVGATQAAIAFLHRHQDGTASKHSERWLAELGLAPGFNMDLADPKVRAAINMWVDGAVLRPDAVDKPLWMSDPHWMLISHLKQFVYSFQETILKRVWHEYMHGNYAPAMALASYVPVMIASDAIKGVLQGGGDMPEWKKDWGPAEYLGSGIERAGLLGKVQFPADGLGMMAGPTVQQAMQVAQALDGKAGKGDLGHAALKALPANPIYAEWMGAAGSRTENSMSAD